MTSKKKLLLFAVAGYNLAETSRMLEIAKAARKDFQILFISYGGNFEELIERENFPLRKMEPRLSNERLAAFRRTLSGETLNTVAYLSREELEIRVPTEIALFKEIKPAAVLTGWCLSVTLSARAAGIPFVNVLHSTTIREYYEAGLQSWPDRSNFAFFRWIFGDSEKRMNKWMSNLVLKLAAPIRAYNRVGPKFGVPRFTNFIDLIEGDYVLLADIPQWVDFPKLRSKVHYIGPLPAQLDLPVPQEVIDLPKDEPIVYFAMGSSGKPELVKEILEGFRNKPYWVIAPVSSHVEDLEVNVPPNVILTGFLPAHKVNALADISVIHGGQNTVMNACLSGTPIVGVGMHPEQQANLDACVRKGFAIRLSKRTVSACDVLEAIDSLLNDQEARKRVKQFRSQLEQWDGPSNAALFLLKTFGGSEIEDSLELQSRSARGQAQ